MKHQIKVSLYVLALAALIAPATSSAQLVLPDAREVLKRYATVTGAAKLTARPTIHMKGTYDVAAAGLSGTFEAMTDKNGRSIQIINITSIGTMMSGSDSLFAWNYDPVQGPRILPPPEFAQVREQEDFRMMMRDPAVVLEAKSMIRSSVGGEDCVMVKMKLKSGRSAVECYSEKTGYLLQSETTQLSSMGEVQVVRLFSEYKTFGALTAPTKVVERAQGLEAIQSITDVTFEAIDPARFTPPPPILALRRG